MKKEYYYLILIGSLIITIIGLVTGKFLFLFLLIPLGFGVFKKRDKDDDHKKLE